MFSAVFLAAVTALSFVPGASAHHSFVAFFDMEQMAEIEGRVTEVRWINPHTKIYVRDANGDTWEVEAGPLNLLSRMGINPSVIDIGDTIRVRGNPGRSDPRALWVANVLLSDDTELLANPTATPYWTANAVGDASSFFEAGDLALPVGGNPSFFRIWTPLITGMPRPQEAPVLTSEGERAQAGYGIGRQVVADCEVPGMPFAMMSPYPIELVDGGDRIVIRGEAYDLERAAFGGPPPPDHPSTPLGYSRARVTGNELLIETSHIDYHSFGDLGPAQSDQSHVVERFTLADDGLTLDYAITVTDPVMLAEPWDWGGSFIYREAAELKPWNCAAE